METTAEIPAGQHANIKVMSPSPHITTPLFFPVPLESTIRELKDRITAALDSRPRYTEQRLIYRGRLLQDDHSIRSVVGASANGENSESSDSYTFHLALKPSGTTPISSPQRTNALNTGSPMSPGATGPQRLFRVPNPPNPLNLVNPLPDPPNLFRVQPGRSSQEALSNIRERLANVRNDILRARAAADPSIVTRVQTHVSYGAPGAAQMAGGLAGNPGAVLRVPHQVSRTTTTTTRATIRLTRGTTQSPPPAPVPSNVPIFTGNGQQLNSIIRGLQAGPNAPPLYLLQGPDGQYALLTGTRAAPNVPRPFNFAPAVDTYLPGESPTEAAQTDPPFGELTPEALARALNPADFGMDGMYQRGLELRQRMRGLAPNVPQAQPQQAAVQRRIGYFGEIMRRVEAGVAHFWLAVRLAIFVVLFSGGGGWRRRLMMSSLALIIFVWQTGMLNNHVRNARALYRELFPLAPPPAARTDPNNPVAVPTQGGNPIDPAATARMLVQRDAERRQNRFLQLYTAIETTLTLFLASLVPGMHEGHVRALEEIERLRVEQEDNEAMQDGGAAEGAAEGVPEGAPVAQPQAEQAPPPVENAGFEGILFPGL